MKPGSNFDIIIEVALNIEWWVGPGAVTYAAGLGYVEPTHIQIKHTVVKFYVLLTVCLDTIV
jgi:hypothetical protein